MTYKTFAPDFKVPSSLYAPIPLPYEGDFEELWNPLLSKAVTFNEEVTCSPLDLPTTFKVYEPGFNPTASARK